MRSTFGTLGSLVQIQPSRPNKIKHLGRFFTQCETGLFGNCMTKKNDSNISIGVFFFEKWVDMNPCFVISCNEK